MACMALGTNCRNFSPSNRLYSSTDNSKPKASERGSMDFHQGILLTGGIQDGLPDVEEQYSDHLSLARTQDA